MKMTENAKKISAPERRCEVVSDELPADLETPVSAYLKLREAGATFLLESAESVDRLGRYSFIGFASGRSLRADSENVFYRDGEAKQKATGDPLEALKAVVSANRVISGEPVPGLLGAAVGYISYDYARFIEDIPRKHEGEQAPVCEFNFVEALVVFDHLTRKMTVYSLVPEGETGPNGLHNEAVEALEAPLNYRGGEKVATKVEFTSNTSAEEYADMVVRVKRHIYNGDCFQIVVSRRVEAQCPVDSFEIYRRLRMGNPSPYMFYLDFGVRKVVGSSPEVLVKLTGRQAVISPIAGTRPRGSSLGADAALEKDLLSDEKERAEHIMLVDLARNDLGRVCNYGSVHVDGFMRVERYSHVMHIVSDVQGELRKEKDQFALFRASFPAGTVTGAPKVRAMEIIEDMEKAPRGIYAGAVGYFSPAGDMDTCIAIRTVVVEGDSVYLQAGAGIVADSDPQKEYQETENKIAALKVALESAAGGGK
jgi:anthranilate synthase component 1